MRFFGPLLARRTSAALLVTLAATGTTGCEFITGVPSVDRVEITVAPPEFPAGTTAQATAVARKDGGGIITHNRRIPKLSSSDPSIATVNASGVVFGVAAGTAEIIAESDGKRASATVTILPPIPARIDVSPEFPTAYVSDTTRLTVTPRTNAGVVITDYSVNCQIANSSVATVVVSGKTCLVRGVAPGATTLLVTVNGVDKTVQLTVQQAKIERVTADIRRPIRVTEQVSVDVRLFGANNAALPTTGRTLTYESSNPTVATVNPQTGVVSALREGTATITVTTEGNLKATTEVVVTQIPVVRVRLLPANAQFRLGVPGQLVRAFALDSLERELSTAGRSVRYSSLDESVVRVSASGVITPVALGTTRLIGVIDNVADTTEVRVTEVPTARVVVDSNQVQRFPGATFQYTATVFDSIGRQVTGRPIRWTSSSTAVQINPTTGLATAIGAGTATIRAEVPRVNGLPEVVFGDAVFAVLQTPIARVAVEPATVSLRVGETRFIGVSVFDAADNLLFGRTIVPTPSPAGIAQATVSGDGSGTVRGLAEGTTTITFRPLDQFGQVIPGISAQITVTVTR